MAPPTEILRLPLNPFRGKDLVILSHGPLTDPTVQIRKKWELIDDYHYEDIRYFLTQKSSLVRQILPYLSEQCSDLKDTCVFLSDHTLTFIELRDKPFIVFETDSNLNEIHGVPQFNQTHFGLTSWETLCNHRDLILSTLFSHNPVLYRSILDGLKRA